MCKYCICFNNISKTKFFDNIISEILAKKIIYYITPPDKTRNIKLSELQSEDKEFDKLANECIMDGYFDREFERMRARFDHQEEEILP